MAGDHTMIYVIEFVFDPELTIAKANALLDELLVDLDGVVSDDYTIDENGLIVSIEFDYIETNPDAVQRWLDDHDGVTADLEGW